MPVDLRRSVSIERRSRKYGHVAPKNKICGHILLSKYSLTLLVFVFDRVAHAVLSDLLDSSIEKHLNAISVELCLRILGDTFRVGVENVVARLNDVDSNFFPTYFGVLESISEIPVGKESILHSLECLLGTGRIFPRHTSIFLKQGLTLICLLTAAVSTPVGPPPQTTN